ncbi:hypothetical protein MBLNU457_3347t1 [Dothideomycetes sp. NU457]
MVLRFFAAALALASVVFSQNTGSNSQANVTAPVGNRQVASTILVIVRNSIDQYSATSGLNAHGIPFQVLTVPQNGTDLPQLNSSSTYGNFGAIILSGEVSYEYSAGWASALTPDQFTQLYNYQVSFGVRLVRLNVYPGSNYDTTPLGGCCGTGIEQPMTFTNSTGIETANYKVGQSVSSKGLWHYPAQITNSSRTWEVIGLGPSSDGTYSTKSSVAVINRFGTREQMVFFTSFATDWSSTSNYLQHIWINWVTRGLFTGRRRIYLSTQIDDVHLTTALYQPSNEVFRLRPGDLDATVAWMKNLNSRLPAGSNYFMEMCHNGNGNIQNVTLNVTGANVCNPYTWIQYDPPGSTALEFKKPLGTGTDKWPTTPTNMSWSYNCTHLDPLLAWFQVPANRDAFAHVSHTFTHLDLDNSTYSDTAKEIQFNKAWLKEVGFADALRFSYSGLVPPAITGMHNGDAIKAWMDNGITAVVGDNTRPQLMNQVNEYWALNSTVASNGYAGLQILPRWATTIYYNCASPNCTLNEWINTSGGAGNYTDLLNNARDTNTRHLFGLHHDPYMFHQADLQYLDTDVMTIGDQTAKFSIMMTWMETITQEMSRLTNWPMISLKHDDIALAFSQRQIRDECNASLIYNYNAAGNAIVSVTLGTNNGGNTCSAPLPVTFPGQVATNNAAVREQVGSDPLVLWTQLSGRPVTYTLAQPVGI